MTKSKYFGDKTEEGYFTNPSTTATSTGAEAPVQATVPQHPIAKNPIEEALDSYTKSAHKPIVTRYAVKRG